MKVLVIHHDLGASCAYTAVVRSAGWEAFTCEDVGDVTRAIRDNDVDVVIFEFSPENGFSALREIHHLDASLPTILVTAHPIDHGEAMSLGVKITLTKPPDPGKLRESLAALTTKLPLPTLKCSSSSWKDLSPSIIGGDDLYELEFPAALSLR